MTKKEMLATIKELEAKNVVLAMENRQIFNKYEDRGNSIDYWNKKYEEEKQKNREGTQKIVEFLNEKSKIKNENITLVKENKILLNKIDEMQEQLEKLTSRLGYAETKLKLYEDAVDRVGITFIMEEY